MRLSYQGLVCYKIINNSLKALLRDGEEIFYHTVLGEEKIQEFLNQCMEMYQHFPQLFPIDMSIHDYNTGESSSINRIYDLSRKKLFIIDSTFITDSKIVLIYLVSGISNQGNPGHIVFSPSYWTGERPGDSMFELVIIKDYGDLVRHSLYFFSMQRGPLTLTKCHGPMSLYTPDQLMMVGHGSHSDPFLSKEKSISEIIERIAKKKYDLVDEKRNRISVANNVIVNQPMAVGETTSGYATHLSKKNALLGAIREHIERDSFLVFWLCKSGGFRVEKPLSGETKSMEDFLFSEQIEIIPFYMQWDHVLGTCMILMRYKEGEMGYKYILVMACSGSFADSYAKCLSDCIQMIHVFTQDMTQSPYASGIAEQHALTYLDPANNADIEWMLDLPTIKSSEIQDKNLTLDEIVDYYERIHPDYRRYQTLHTEYDDIYDRVTVRVVSPYILPFYFGKEVPSYVLSHPRLAYRKNKLGVSEINTAMHPMT